MDELWLVVLASAGLLARVGMAVYGCGLVRSKNAAGTLARHLADFCVTTLVIWAVGMAVLWQTRNGYLSLEPSLLFGNARAASAQTLVYALLTLLSTGIIINTLAERARFAVTLALSVVMAAVVVPVLGHLAWFGALAQQGFTDLGGAAVIHFAGGVAAAVAALFVGPRTGKFNRDRSSNAIPGHSVPLMGVGVLLMLVGWVPMLAAAALARDISPATLAVKTVVAGAAGGLMALWYGRLRYGKVDIFLMTAGLLGALVAVSAGPTSMHPAFALLTGAVAGILVPVAAVHFDLRMKLDDPTSGIAIHAVGGLLGTLAAALLGPSPKLIGIHLLAIAVVASTTVAVTALTLFLLRLVVPLRSPEADEYDGLDLAEHDINAYPDFSQTMIKSYHLREA
jgi:Amt family ammonium transporter